MIHPGKIIAALEARRECFADAEVRAQQSMNALRKAVGKFESLKLEEIKRRLAGVRFPGARPTAEHKKYTEIIVPFAENWHDHRQAREWALGILQGVSTCAVDGSQISPSRELSIPVGVVQVGWFENCHQTDGSYVKDIDVKVLTPEEFGDLGGLESGFPDRVVNWRRFEMEIDRLAAYMQANTDTEPKSLCFFDGSLVVSFVRHMHPERQELYTGAVIRLLETSEKSGVPLVGYVDTSYARDLIGMLTLLVELQQKGSVSDAGLLHPQMGWGDRSQVFICARDDGVKAGYYEKVCFVYLKTTAGNPPARVEFPCWVFEQGKHEQVLDMVRAECVVGTGYPYAIEAADAVAVLTMEDRERFHRLFQEFAERKKLPLRFTCKSLSKRGRRV